MNIYKIPQHLILKKIIQSKKFYFLIIIIGFSQ